MIDNQKMSIILPARIVEYFPETQTATIQICIDIIYSDAVAISESKAREPLEEVPVHTVSGGGWALTMPIKAGDTCLMYFSQQGYDHWLYEDKNVAGLLANLPKPWLRRQFSDDDGLALVGFNTLPRAIQQYSANHSQWRNDDTNQMISLNEDLSIDINSTVSVTINAPEVVINCETANVNATTKLTVDSPESQFTGNVQIDGELGVTLAATMSSTLNVVAAIGGTGGLAISGGSGAAITGDLSSTGAVTGITFNGVTIETHTHTETGTGGGETLAPT